MATTQKKKDRKRLPEPETFVWTGVDRTGRKLKGETTAGNANAVKAELRKQGIKPGTVRKKPKPLFGGTGKPITPGDIAIFSRMLATMIASGVPLVQAFDIIASGSNNPNFQKMLKEIKTSVEGGSTLTEALAEHPLQFDSLYINLVNAGEQAGVLDQLLDTIATYKERVEELKAKIKKALFYPAMVMVVAVVVSAVLLIFVIPQFETVFKSFGADLPGFTMMLINASKFIRGNALAISAILIFSIVGFIQLYKRSRKLQLAIDRMSLKIPVIGPVLEKAAIARFTRTLATTFAAGVPLVEALDTVAGATGNIVFEEATRQVQQDVATGHQLQLAMKQTGVFPHMVIQMTAIGEESGSLDSMLNKVADFYENEVNNTVDALSSLMEPLVMVVIGVLVGGMVIGMYLPIFKLGAVV